MLIEAFPKGLIGTSAFFLDLKFDVGQQSLELSFDSCLGLWWQVVEGDSKLLDSRGL